MEVVISVAIIGIVIPVVMAMTVAGGRSSAEAVDETRAMFLVRSVMEEIELARRGSGQFIEGELGWPEFPDGGGRLVLLADRGGALLEAAEGPDYEQGVSLPEAAYVVSVRGVFHPLPDRPENRDLSKVEITVETPARADSDNRRKMRFFRLWHPDD